MFSISDYGAMLFDTVRVSAYRDALTQCIDENSVVLEIGAGVGTFAILAAKLGARHVTAVEQSPLIRIGEKDARYHGVADRIDFVHGRSQAITLRERANVLISDLRGALPFHSDGFETIEDAKARLLTDTAILVPNYDRVLFIPVGLGSDDRFSLKGPWSSNVLDMAFPAAQRVQNSRPFVPKFCLKVSRDEPALLAEIAYRDRLALETGWQTGEWYVDRPGQLDGLLLWFESTLFGRVSLSAVSESARPSAYGRLLLPLPEPVDLHEGCIIRGSVCVSNIGGTWIYRWRVEVKGPRGLHCAYDCHSLAERLATLSRG